MFLLRGMRYMQTPKLCVTPDHVDVLTFLSLALSIPFSITATKLHRVVSLLFLLPGFLNLAGSSFTPRSALNISTAFGGLVLLNPAIILVCV